MFGPRLRSARLNARLSQAVLGTLAGISQPFIAQIERGDRVPSPQVARALAAALKIPLETLLGQGEQGSDVADVSPDVEIKPDAANPASGRLASPGLLDLMADSELLAFLKVRPDEWITLSSIQTFFPLKKEGYVQLLLTLRAVSQDHERAA